MLHEGVGPVSVEVDDGVATLTTPRPPAPVEAADPGEVAAALGLELSDLHPELGPRGWSAGVPFTMVAVRDLMGRPSEIRVRVVQREVELVAVRVGGRAVCIGSDELVVPTG